jgi:hypothetical protein
MIWGLLPIVLLSLNYDSQNIGIIATIASCFGVWTIGGKYDVYSKKMLFGECCTSEVRYFFIQQLSTS